MHEYFYKVIYIHHRASGTLGVLFFVGWAPHPAEILCWNSRRAWKVTESDFPQEESLKVTILTGGVSAKLAGRAFRLSLNKNTVRGPNVAKTLGGDPPH